MAGITRRDVLGAGLAFLGGTILGKQALALLQRSQEKRRMVQIGIQSYCLRDLPWEKAMEHAQGLGVTAWEVFPGHIPPTLDDEARQIRQRMSSSKMAMPNYGVVALGSDASADQKQFEFARLMGIRVLTADPDPTRMSRLAQMCEEFNVRVAIHNHGPNSRYHRLADVQKALEGVTPLVGACVDTGHFIRSREDPVAAIRTLGSRVLAVHLKDYIDEKTETVLGEGRLDLDATMKALKEIRFEGLIAVEYELDPSGSGDALARCLSAARAAAAKHQLV